MSWHKMYTYCNAATISSGDLIGEGNITCFSGCSLSTPLLVHCTDFSDYFSFISYGRNSITFTADATELTFGFNHTDFWRHWIMKTTANLTLRPDTNRINSSPTVDMIPFMHLPYGCPIKFTLPVYDADGDIIRCRFANSYECAYGCNSFPANLTDCVLQIVYNGSSSETIVAVQIEDFLSNSSTTPLSSVSMQFMVYIPGYSCNNRPVFVSPTPAANSCFSITADTMFRFTVKAISANASIVTIDTVSNGPTTQLSSGGRLDVNWTPASWDAGSHDFCFAAIDNHNRQSEYRCVQLFVEAKPKLADIRKTENDSFSAWQLIYDKAIHRPSTLAFILVYDENDTVYERLNATSDDVEFGGSYIRFGFHVNFGKSSYILIETGVVLGGCRQPSDQIVLEKRECSNPPTILHGIWEEVNRTLNGGYAKLTCDSGYQTSGDVTIFCDADGAWQGKKPACIILDCGPLHSVSNGSVKYNGTTYGETATYTCDKGFHISNDSLIIKECTTNGTWSGEIPQCIIKDCGPLNDLKNGSLTYNGSSYGETATYSCDTGFYINNESLIKRECTEYGLWSGETPQCIIKDCGPLHIVSNASVKYNGTTYGETATYTCDKGFDINNESLLIRECTTNGTWSGEIPQCIIKDCSAPHSVENGSVTFNNTTYGETARYRCNTGFYISNESLITRQCNEDGSWSGQTPNCTIKDCNMPVDVEFTHLTYTGTTYGESVTYTCKDGYFLRRGNNVRHCEEDALWNGSKPSCTDKFHAGYACLADVTGVSQCVSENVSCRFDAATGTFRCLCSEDRILPPEEEAKCLDKSAYGEKCETVKQCTTFLSECIRPGMEPGTCGCPGGTSYNKTADECTTNAVTFCQASVDRLGRWWNKTRVLTIAYQQCPTGSYGQIIRTCRADGLFSTALYNCTKEIFNIINNQIQSTNMTTTEALGSLQGALAGIKNSSSEIHAGDVDGIETVLMQITEKEVNETTSVEQLKQNAQTFFDIADMLTDPETSGPAWESKIEQTSTGAERFIETIDRFSLNLATTIETSNETKLTIQKDNLVVSVSKVSEVPDIDLKYPEEGESHPFNTNQTSSFTLRSESLEGQSDKVTSVVVVVYRDISKALPKTNVQQRSQPTVRTINSQVLSIQLLPKPPDLLNPPIQLTFSIDNQKPGYEPHCAFWKSSTDGTQGGWSTSGCVRTMANATTVQCSCNHLTNFAILTSPIETPSEHQTALTAISLTGCGVSIVCLVITIILHVSYWRLLKGDRNMIAMTLCVSLLVAYLLFVFGVTRTSVKGVCTTVAVLLHYTFLLVLFLLLSEGIYMALQVVLPFHKKSHLKELLIGAFAIPAFFVLIVASATGLHGYGNDKYCWLTVDSVAFWMFVGPALLVIIFNLTIIILIIKKMYGTKWIKDMNQQEKFKTLASKTLVMLPVMGVTWLFGILSVHESAIWLQYLFVLFNSFQGLFIFLFHCVLNRQLRAAIAKSRQQFSTLSEESSRSRATTDHSTNQTTNTHIEPPSTVTYDAKTDHVTTVIPAPKPIIEDDPPAMVSEEEKKMFKKRHAIPLQTADGENKPRRPPIQVFIDLQHELRGRLRNLADAVMSRASKMFNSTQRDTVIFTRNVSKQSLQKQPRDDQVEIINDEAENGEDSVKDGCLEAEIHAVVTISLDDEVTEDCTDSKENHEETSRGSIEHGNEERVDFVKEREEKQTGDKTDRKQQVDEEEQLVHASRRSTADVMIDPIENVNEVGSVVTQEEPGDIFCKDDSEKDSDLASDRDR